VLQNTFSHLPGIGLRTEQQLWGRGVHSWDIFRAEATPLPFGKARAAALRRDLEHSLLRLHENDARFFAQRLPPELHWRLFRDFRHSTAYLDIETTGLGLPDDHITTIALYDGKSVRTYVYGENLHRFAADVAAFELVVTYNGKCFDLPFIRGFLGIDMDQAHIDLRYVLKSVGYSGGLKGCERQAGIARDALEGVDGYFAVLLWQEYVKRNDVKALETLLAYNAMDTVNLETLMVLAYNLKLRDTPFHDLRVGENHTTPDIPFKPDIETIDRIRRRFFGYS
jgi:uncharacterized protein